MWLDINEHFSINALYIIIIPIIYDLFNNNYIYQNIILIDYTAVFLTINLIGIILFLKYFKVRVRFNLNINFEY